MVTSAQFQLISDWPDTVAVNATGENLKQPPPSPFYVHAALPTPDPPAGIQADNSTSQSRVDFTFKNTEIHIDVGRFAFNAGVSFQSGPAEQCQALVAPVDPGNPQGWDFFIWLLASPGKLQKVVDSIIQANLDSLKKFIPQIGPIEKDLVTITFEKIDVEGLKCTYAGVSKQGQTSNWILNVVLSFDGALIGDTKPGGPFEFELKGSQIYLGITIDAKGEGKPFKVYVHQMQCAVRDIDGSLPIGSPLSYYLPAYVNTTENKTAIDALNSLIDKAVATIPLDQLPTYLSKYNLDSKPKSPVSTKDLSEWMSKPSIQAKSFGQLKIAGTHDSGAYKLESTLSEVSYGDLAFLWNLRDGKAPEDHDVTKPPYYVGSDAYAYIMKQVNLVGQSQDEICDIQKQLQDGIRSFDLRIYYDTRENDYYIHHSLRGPKVSDILLQIKAFIDQYPSAAEFAVFELSHSQFSDSTPGPNHTATMAAMIRDTLGPSVYMPPNVVANERFDFQKLTKTELSSITQGRSKVLFVNTDDCTYPHTVLNTLNGSFFPSTPEKTTPSGDGLYTDWLTGEASVNSIIGYILINCFNANAKYDPKMLQNEAFEMNAKVKDELVTWPGATRFVMDWYTESHSAVLPVETIVNAND